MKNFQHLMNACKTYRQILLCNADIQINDIEIDFVHAIQITDWPNQASTWPTRARKWPNEE